MDLKNQTQKRTIKFRAWNIPNKTMYYDVQNGILAENEKGQVVLGVSLGTLCKDAGSIVMQFTGLLDKNGKEIYEGDILKKMGTDYSKWEENNYEGEEPLIMEKIDVATMERFPTYWLKNEDFGYEGEDLENHFNWEVVGNIYENPELLTD